MNQNESRPVEDEVLEHYPTLKPAPDMTREEFIEQFPTVRMMPHITYNGRTVDLSELKRIISLKSKE